MTPNPEMTLPPKERRKRAKRMARITAGCNAPTRRQIRRLTGNNESWMLKRIMRKQGMTKADL